MRENKKVFIGKKNIMRKNSISVRRRNRKEDEKKSFSMFCLYFPCNFSALSFTLFYVSGSFDLTPAEMPNYQKRNKKKTKLWGGQKNCEPTLK